MILILDNLCKIDYNDITIVDNNKECLKILLSNNNIDVLCLYSDENNKYSLKVLLDAIFDYKIYPQSIFIYGDDNAVKCSLEYYLLSKDYNGTIDINVDLKYFRDFEFRPNLLEHLKLHKLKSVIYNDNRISILNKIHKNDTNEEIRIYKIRSRIIFRRKLSYKNSIIENNVCYNESSGKIKHRALITKLLNDGFVPLKGVS